MFISISPTGIKPRYSEARVVFTGEVEEYL